jgi:hypothetical protein
MKYEGSKEDRMNDRKQARKHKESLKDWEKSAMDKKMDRAGQKKINKRKK